MNGVKQERLIKTLAKLRARCCSYIGPICDCKFVLDATPDNTIMTQSETGSCCPELMQVAFMIANMTEQEYYAIAKRAGVNIDFNAVPAIDVGALLREEKEKRDNDFRKAKPLKPIKESKTRKGENNLISPYGNK